MNWLKHLFHKPSPATLVSKVIGSSDIGNNDITYYVFKCDCCGKTWKEWVWGVEER